MVRYGLKIVPEKIEVLILKSKGRPRGISFRIDEHDLDLSKTLKYLCVTFDNHETFGAHVITADNKVMEKSTKLARIMPNLRGLNSKKRAVYCTQWYYIEHQFGAGLWESKNTKE